MLSVELFKIQEGARAFYGALIELLPDVESFQSEVYNVQPLLIDSKESQHSLLKSLQRQLELLQTQVIQIKSDVCGMKSTIQVMVKNRSSTGFDSFVPATAVLKYEKLDDDADNFENSYAARNDKNPETQFITQDKAQDSEIPEVRKTKLSSVNVMREIASTTTSKAKKCYYCDEKIHNRSKHMQKHHPGLRNFPCNICGSKFDEYKDFQSHKKIHTVVLAYKCDMCNSTLKNLRNMRNHLKSHGGEKPYVCLVCGQGFKSKASLAKCKHRMVGRGVSDKPGFQCKLCGNVFATLNLMNLHFRKECSSKENDEGGCVRIKEEEEKQGSDVNTGSEQIHRCRICPKTFSLQWMLKQHMNIHTGDKPFKCEFCYRKFHTSKAKGVHKYLKHSGTYQGFKCKICGEQCKSYLGREAHYLKHTPEEMASYNINIKMAECDVCGKIVRKNYLTNHKISHSSKDSFICEICGRGFKRAANLKKHGIVHMKPQDKPILKPRQRTTTAPRRHQIREKKYICNVCGKAFGIRFQLILHNRIHTGEKPHRCDACGKAFTTPQGLKTHEVVHTKIKAFKCEICGDSFTSQSNLRRHHSIHTGDRPFQCDFCGKRFVQKVHLECHRRVHTGERPYQCKHCGEKFADPSTLHKHKAKHDKDFQGNLCNDVKQTL